MAAFSYQHFPSGLSSMFVPNTSNMMPSLILEEDTCFSPICPQDYLQETPLHVQIQESDETSCRTNPFTCTDPSSTVKQNKDSPSMVVELEIGDQGTNVATPMEKKRKKIVSKVARESKGKKQESKGRKQKISDAMSKNEEEKKLKADKKEKKKAPKEVPTGYIHVRARRGQATDSHSLAERVRREKISERMKLLQYLVPGCDKITGKAQVLDEIINYVQSLQNQVEFLISELASVSSCMLNDFEVDLDTNRLPSEFKFQKLCSLEPQFPAELQSGSTKLSSLAETIPTPTSFFSQQEQRSKIITQDNRLQFWDTNDQILNFVNQYGFNNACPF